MDQICVGICTYKRCDSLARLLEKLRFQYTNGLFTYSVLVVDNDLQFSAEPILKNFYTSDFELSYYNEKDKNIAKARNRVLELAEGNYLALIDDDEYPDDFWLHNHYSTCKKFNAYGSLGPVISELPEMCPEWIRKSDVCNRRSFETGFKIKPNQARTGNCFLKNEKNEETRCMFDVEFGITGGEDLDFFYRLINKMKRHVVWCQEAVVYEPVTSSRLNRKFYIKRAIKRGGNHHKFLKKNKSHEFSIFMILLSFFKMLAILCISPFILFCKEKIKMKIIESFFHHFGRIGSLFNKI